MQRSIAQGGDAGAQFFLLGAAILFGITDIIPALYRTLFTPEEKDLSDEEKLEQIEEGLEGLKRFFVRGLTKLEQLVVVSLFVAAVAVVDRRAASVMGGTILFILIVQDWGEIEEALRQAKPPRRDKNEERPQMRGA